MTNSTPSPNFPFQRNTPAPNVVRAALTMFQADCERKLNHLNAMRSGTAPLDADRLADLWTRLKDRCETPELAFRLLVQTIAAELGQGSEETGDAG